MKRAWTAVRRAAGRMGRVAIALFAGLFTGLLLMPITRELSPHTPWWLQLIMIAYSGVFVLVLVAGPVALSWFALEDMDTHAKATGQRLDRLEAKLDRILDAKESS